MSDLGERPYIGLAKRCEDAAEGLHRFRDRLPKLTTQITAAIGKLFDISSRLREVDHAQGDRRYAASFYLVQGDWDLLRPSLKYTLELVFDMFAQTRAQSVQATWDNLARLMENDEGVGLVTRLEWYQDFLEAQFAVITGMPSPEMRDLRRALVQLVARQEDTQRRVRRSSADISASTTPRPPPQSRPQLPRMTTPRSPPESVHDTWERPMPPPFAPEPPQAVPLSPTYTSSSSNTLNSSQTSYSSEMFNAPPRALRHWAQTIFDGEQPTTPFTNAYQLRDRSRCLGTPDPSVYGLLAQDDCIKVLDLPFNGSSMSVRLYWQPSNDRARIVIATRDRTGREEICCRPLTDLRIIREGSVLRLCKLRRDFQFTPWAELNFYMYERMVLFYCTFVGLKRQDQRNVPDEHLLDIFELGGPEGSLEREEFGGKVRDGDMQHALRLYYDRTSGVVRLEASPLRGPKQDVPIWTAFITKYAVDPDHVAREGSRGVSFAALRPPPYVFLDDYRPPRNRHGEYCLEFTSREDADCFMETWAGLARAL